MSENKVNKTKGEEPSRTEDLEFDVMPKTREGETAPETPATQGSVPPEAPGHRWRVWLISIAGLTLLAVLGYLVYLNFFANYSSDEEVPRIDAPALTDGTSPLDTDNDGLTDEREFELGTDPNNPDTDNDGLADGDEVNIYGSDPLLSDTDGDGFDDGGEVARGFSPVTASSEKADSEEVRRWSERIGEFGLHEPTRTTVVSVDAEDKPATEVKTYTNSEFNYQIGVPELLAVRESTDMTRAGLYVAGTSPEEQDVLTDPIAIELAVKQENQTLSEWIESVYGGRYRDLDTLMTTKGLEGTKLSDSVDSKVDGCVADITLFSRDSRVIQLFWNCNNQREFLNLYEQVILSFEFINA